MENRKNAIDKVNAIFFTDGGDGGDFQKTYTYLNNIKATFGSQITLYIRGLGKENFKTNEKQHLAKIATLINSGSEVNISLKDVDLVNDIDEVTKFFISISKGITDYYAAIKEKLKALESLKDALQDEDMRMRQKNHHVQDYEIARLDSLEKTDFKKAEEKETLLVAFRFQMDEGKKSVVKLWAEDKQ